jgi:putative PIN family toxin of toxin-antitoxin system
VRVVLDTNILLSALIRGDSVPGRILVAWFEDQFVLLMHPFLIEELRAVSRRPQIRSLIRPAQAGRLVNQIRALAEPVTRLPATRRSADPADDFLLAMAEAGQADYLVTGDKAGLLALKRHHAAMILTARAFLDVLHA